MFREITTGVLLGLAGAAFLELAKAVLDLALLTATPVDARVYAGITFSVIFVVALMLAALAYGTTAGAFAVYAVPVAFFALIACVVALEVVVFIGWVPSPQMGDLRQLLRVLGPLGFALLLLGLADLAITQYRPIVIGAWGRLRRPRQWLVAHSVALLIIVGSVLLGISAVLGR